MGEKNIQFKIQATLPTNILLEANGKLIMNNLYFLIFLSQTPSPGNNIYLFSVAPLLGSLRNKLFSRSILKIMLHLPGLNWYVPAFKMKLAMSSPLCQSLILTEYQGGIKDETDEVFYFWMV